jgi:predicted nucleic acid-binding protein
VDCLVAVVALRADVPILHRDADFDAIAACLPLRIED